MEKTVAAMLPRRAKGADARLSLSTATGRQLVRSQKRPIVTLPRSRPLGDVGSRCSPTWEGIENEPLATDATVVHGSLPPRRHDSRTDAQGVDFTAQEKNGLSRDPLLGERMTKHAGAGLISHSWGAIRILLIHVGPDPAPESSGVERDSLLGRGPVIPPTLQ